MMAQEKGPLTEQAYLDALAECRRLSRDGGHRRGDGARTTRRAGHADGRARLEDRSRSTAITISAAAHNPPRWPAIQRSACPLAICRGLPVGLTFMGQAYSEPKLIQLAYAFEQATQARRAPTYPAETP